MTKTVNLSIRFYFFVSCASLSGCITIFRKYLIWYRHFTVQISAYYTDLLQSRSQLITPDNMKSTSRLITQSNTTTFFPKGDNRVPSTRTRFRWKTQPSLQIGLTSTRTHPHISGNVKKHSPQWEFPNFSRKRFNMAQIGLFSDLICFQ